MCVYIYIYIYMLQQPGMCIIIPQHATLHVICNAMIQWDANNALQHAMIVHKASPAP